MPKQRLTAVKASPAVTTERAMSSSGRRNRPGPTGFVKRSEIHGHKVSPPSNPPDVTYQPWFPVTLIFAAIGTLNIQVKDIATKLKEQLDPTHRGFNSKTSGDGRFIVQLRIHSVMAWNLTANARLIALSVDDFHDTTSATGGRDQLCGIVDTGGSSSAPKAGYVLPIGHRSMVLRNDDKEDEVYLINITAGAKDQILAHLKIHFRFDGPSTLPLLFNTLSDISENTSRIGAVVTDIYNTMPSIKPTPLGYASLVINENPLQEHHCQSASTSGTPDSYEVVPHTVDTVAQLEALNIKEQSPSV